PVRVRLADGAVTVGGRIDVVLGGAPTERPAVLVEVKGGRRWDGMRADAHPHALVVALPDRPPPAAAGTVPAAGTTQVQPRRPARAPLRPLPGPSRLPGGRGAGRGPGGMTATPPLGDAVGAADRLAAAVTAGIDAALDAAPAPPGDVDVGWVAALDATACPARFRGQGETGWGFPGWTPATAAGAVARSA